MKKFESAIDFQQFAKTLNIEDLQQLNIEELQQLSIEELQRLSIELSKKHKQVFEQYEK